MQFFFKEIRKANKMQKICAFAKFHKHVQIAALLLFATRIRAKDALYLGLKAFSCLGFKTAEYFRYFTWHFRLP